MIRGVLISSLITITHHYLLMNEFILSARRSLEEMEREVSALAEARGRSRRELIEKIFRHTHTLKGTLSAAGLEETASLAHEIENLLDSLRLGRVRLDEERVGVLIESAAALAEGLNARDEAADKELIERLRGLAAADDEESPQVSEELLASLPDEIASALNAYEKHRLSEAAEEGLNLFVIAFNLSLSSFDEKFRELSSALSARGEIISTLPGVEEAEAEQISFRLLYATQETHDTIAGLAESVVAVTLTELRLAGEVEGASADFINQVPEAYEVDESVSVSHLLERAARVGEAAAQTAGKEIEFEVASGSDLHVAAKLAEAISNALLHLVRNAVDHGIEFGEERARAGKSARGRVKLEARNSANRLALSVSDDGRGIDTDEITRVGVERGLIKQGEVVSTEDAMRLIFRQGFSTAASVTNLSGRGVGLDVVETVVKELGGEVLVKSEQGKGTTFEIILSLERRT